MARPRSVYVYNYSHTPYHMPSWLIRRRLRGVQRWGQRVAKAWSAEAGTIRRPRLFLKGRHVPTPGAAYRIDLLDQAGPGGIAGEHTLEGDQVIAKVYMRTILTSRANMADDIDELTRVLSHELAEMMIDPAGDYVIEQGSTGKFWKVEICDPVNTHTFEVLGARVSDWCYPSWYTNGDEPYDHEELLNNHHKILAGGYGWYYDGSGHDVEGPYP